MVERRTHTLMAVLRVLLDAPRQEHYGLELAQEAGIRPGSVYPILARLEADGWIVGTWEEIDEAAEGRRKRRYFQLTGHGVTAAQALLAEWERDTATWRGELPGLVLP